MLAMIYDSGIDAVEMAAALRKVESDLSASLTRTTGTQCVYDTELQQRWL
jgi:hypothetical protein